MATIKVIELLAESDKSSEDAAQVALAKAAESLRGIRSVYIKEMEVKVQNNRIVAYRVNAKVSFALED